MRARLHERTRLCCPAAPIDSRRRSGRSRLFPTSALVRFEPAPAPAVEPWTTQRPSGLEKGGCLTWLPWLPYTSCSNADARDDGGHDDHDDRRLPETEA